MSHILCVLSGVKAEQLREHLLHHDHTISSIELLTESITQEEANKLLEVVATTCGSPNHTTLSHLVVSCGFFKAISGDAFSQIGVVQSLREIMLSVTNASCDSACVITTLPIITSVDLSRSKVGDK